MKLFIVSTISMLFLTGCAIESGGFQRTPTCEAFEASYRYQLLAQPGGCPLAEDDGVRQVRIVDGAMPDSTVEETGCNATYDFRDGGRLYLEWTPGREEAYGTYEKSDGCTFTVDVWL